MARKQASKRAKSQPAPYDPIITKSAPRSVWSVIDRVLSAAQCEIAGRTSRRAVDRARVAMVTTEPLTQLEWSGKDFVRGKRIAETLGYAQYVYTSTSALWGMFCLAENPEHTKGPARGGCIIKTRELGFMFVQLADGDLNLEGIDRS